MKVCLHKYDSNLNDNKIKIIIEFIKLLQKEYPLNEDISIFLMGKRKGKMSTGSRTPNYSLKILTEKRMMRDILRTIGHEWVHEYDTTILKKPRTADVGGENENKANSESGRLVKLFEKTHPDFEEWLYE